MHWLVYKTRNIDDEIGRDFKTAKIEKNIYDKRSPVHELSECLKRARAIRTTETINGKI